MSDYVAPRENNGTFIFTSSHSVVRSRLPFPPPLSTMGILSGDEKICTHRSEQLNNRNHKIKAKKKKKMLQMSYSVLS